MEPARIKESIKTGRLRLTRGEMVYHYIPAHSLVLTGVYFLLFVSPLLAIVSFVIARIPILEVLPGTLLGKSKYFITGSGDQRLVSEFSEAAWLVDPK